jgi:hypothetical protein
MNLTPEDVPKESKFLLEVDFAWLRTGDLTGQHYWVHAVKAVWQGDRKPFCRVDEGWLPPVATLIHLNNLPLHPKNSLDAP